METNMLVLEYVRVLLSPQSITGALVVILLFVFRKDVRALLSRLAVIKFPGGELSITQEQKSKDLPADENKAPQVPEDMQLQLPQGIKLTPDQMTQLRDFVNAERAKAFLWEYRYLNFFLVYRTQAVLDWLAKLPQKVTISLFDALWLPTIPNAQERIAVIGALQSHHLIQLDGELISVTPKGREYIQWRGPLPAAAAS